MDFCYDSTCCHAEMYTQPNVFSCMHKPKSSKILDDLKRRVSVAERLTSVHMSGGGGDFVLHSCFQSLYIQEKYMYLMLSYVKNFYSVTWYPMSDVGSGLFSVGFPFTKWLLHITDDSSLIRLPSSFLGSWFLAVHQVCPFLQELRVRKKI